MSFAVWDPLGLHEVSDRRGNLSANTDFFSWNQRYQSETSSMLDELNLRLRSIDSNPRPPSMWHHSSTGSIGSSNGGSLSYGSPQHVAPAQGVYHHPQQTPASIPAMPVHPVQQISPPAQSYFQPPMQQASPPIAPPHAAQSIPQQQPQFDPHQSLYNVNGLPSPPHAQRFDAPASQFANWAGYRGVGGHPDTLDEENAVPPGSMSSNPWNYEQKG